MHRTGAFILSTLILGVTSTTSLSEEPDISAITGMALDSFYGACLTEKFSLSMTVPIIAGLPWKEIDGATMAPLAPEGEMEYLKGWFATNPGKDNPLPFILILGRPKDRWMETESCTIYVNDVIAEEFAEAFISETGASEVEAEMKWSETFRSFSLPDNPDVIVSLHYNSRLGATGMVASAMHTHQPAFP